MGKGAEGHWEKGRCEEGGGWAGDELPWILAGKEEGEDRLARVCHREQGASEAAGAVVVEGSGVGVRSEVACVEEALIGVVGSRGGVGYAEEGRGDG